MIQSGSRPLSYLKGSGFYVSISSFRTAQIKRVPQGSSLRSLLFNFYKLLLGTVIYKNISFHSYADDIQLYLLFCSQDL